MKNKLVLKFLSFSYGSWIGLILGLLYTVITTRLIDPVDFGKASMYTLAINILMIITIFGTDQSFVRFFYEEKEENRGGLLYNCLKIPIITIFIVLFFVMVFYEKITIFLFGDSNILMAIILILGVISQLIYRYAKLVIRMQQKGNLYSILEILQKLFILLFLIVLFFMIGASYEVVVYAAFLTTFILTILAVFFGGDLWKFKNISRKNLFHTKRDIIKFGSPFILTIFLTWLFQAMDKFALRLWGDFEELGLYSAAYNIIALLIVLQSTFSTFWTPVSYDRYEKDPSDKNFFKQITNIVSIAMFFVAIVTIAGKDVIVLFLGKEYEMASTYMPFLVFIPILYTLSETTVIGINFKKKTRWHILIAIVACLTNIVGNWLLVPDYGAIGASISTAFSYIIFFLLRTHLSLKFYKVDYELNKIYFMIILISLYAFASILLNSMFMNILLGFIPLIILIILYRNVLMGIIRKIKN